MSQSLAETLRRLRTEKGLTQQQLASQLYVDRSSVAHWESGRRVPDAMLLSRIAAALDVDVSLLLSAAVGELPEHYADVDFPNYNGSMSFTATNASGEKGVIGLYGNTLIPFSEDNRYVYPSVDGQVVVVSAPGSVYKIYRFDASDLVPASAETEVQPEDGTWTCANGHSGNTGKFCTECGAPMPADDGTWTCENGHSGNTGNFCGECGAPRP